jgi:hypothetical protein
MISNFDDYINESNYRSSEAEYIYNKIINRIDVNQLVNNPSSILINKYGIKSIIIQPINDGTGWNGFFDSIKSFKSENGWVLYISLKKIENHTLFHELHHCLQFVKTDGKSHDLYNDFNDIYYEMYFRSSNPIRQFEELIYKLTPKESEAHLAEVSYMIEHDINNPRIDEIIGNYLVNIDIIKNDNLDINFSDLDKKKLSKVFNAIDYERKEEIKLKKLTSDESEERMDFYSSMKGSLTHFDKVFGDVISYLRRRCNILEKKFRRLQALYITKLDQSTD